MAARQQTSLSTLDSQASQTQAVLQQSQAATGEIQQLQLIAQMIGITNSELLVLEPDARNDRSCADGHGRRRARPIGSLSLGKSDDARAGYTDKGAPDAVPSTMP